MPFSVQTDQELYAEGNTITISGVVDDYAELGTKNDVTIIIRNPDGVVAGFAQLTPGPTGEYSTSIIAHGQYWKAAGEYKVEANFAVQKITTTFEFAGISGTAPPPPPPTNPVRPTKPANTTQAVQGQANATVRPTTESSNQTPDPILPDPMPERASSDNQTPDLAPAQTDPAPRPVTGSSGPVPDPILILPDPVPGSVAPDPVPDQIPNRPDPVPERITHEVPERPVEDRTVYYAERYTSESGYKQWFDSYFGGRTLVELVPESPSFGMCGGGTELRDGICQIIVD